MHELLISLIMQYLKANKCDLSSENCDKLLYKLNESIEDPAKLFDKQMAS